MARDTVCLYSIVGRGLRVNVDNADVCPTALGRQVDIKGLRRLCGPSNTAGAAGPENLPHRADLRALQRTC